MLPYYPSDKVAFTEFLRQLHEVHTFLRNKHKAIVTFPFEMGMYTCKSTSDAKNTSNELSRYNIKFLAEKRSYNPWGQLASTLGRRSIHTPLVEDFWSSCEDEFEVRRRNYGPILPYTDL